METKVGDESAGKCPFTHIAGVGRTNRDWWPTQLRLELLHRHSAKSDPMAKGFDYAKDVALVLTDMNMPLMDGIATTRALRSLSRGVRVVVSSGLATHGDAAERSDLRDGAFIQKPFRAASLLTLRRQELHREQRAKS